MPVNSPFAKIERDEGEETIASQKQKAAKMNGMVLDDSRVIYAMDSRTSGDIVPAAIKKDGENSGTLISLKQMGLLMKRVEKILDEMAVSLHEGKIPVSPAFAQSTTSPYHDVCKYCDYKDVCGLDEDTKTNDIVKVKHDESLRMLGGEDDA